jgi:hypothetical protein
VYGETPPGDVGGAQPALTALFAEYPPARPVLDVGCGSGDMAIWLARRAPRHSAGSFGAVVDSGFFQLFDPDDGDRFAAELAATVRPRGRCYLLAFR